LAKLPAAGTISRYTFNPGMPQIPDEIRVHVANTKNPSVTPIIPIVIAGETRGSAPAAT
jgi:hypothetical protein